MDLRDIIKYVNKAAGLKIGRFGNSQVVPYEVFSDTPKLIGIQEVIERTRDKKIVFTNGCFDVLHAGHIDLLNKASLLGDVLVVGINSDDSIRRIKGNKRPINSLVDRAKVLSALECVDFIVSFDEDTSDNVIRQLCPSVLVKGGDYTEEEIVGADYVKKRGGKVRIIPFVHHVSSTSLIEKLGL